MILGHGQVQGPAVDLAGPGVHDLGLDPLPEGLEDPQLRTAVDLEIGEGIGHGVDVTHLAREIEDHVLALDQVFHGMAAHVGDVDAHLVLVAIEVEQVPAIIGKEQIDRGHPHAQVGEPAAEIGPDETQAPRDQHGAIPVGVEMPGHGRAAAFRWLLLMVSSTHRSTRSRRVRKTRGKLKNWLVP